MELRQCLYILFIFFIKGGDTKSFQEPSCHEEESTALLQFKQSFTIDTSASGYDGAYSKVSSWQTAEGETSNCCSWDGIGCDERTGRVINIDLSSSYLYGNINSNSTLFRLVHLQRLNLADNNFNHTQIPTTIGNFPRLRYLNLSSSVFSGHVPSEVSQLSKLSSLDLSLNTFSGPIPSSLANLTQLTYLSLASNNFVRGPLFWVGKQTKLTFLDLESINLNGSIPSSLSNLTQLTYLSLRFNQLSGPIPSWLGNLSKLVTIDFVVNSLTGLVPVSLFDLMELKKLSLSVNELHGNVDFCKLQSVMKVLQLGGNKLEVLTECGMKNTTVFPQFSHLGLSSCNIKEFPHFLMHQQSLRWLDLSLNKLHGQIPKWMWNTSTQSLAFLNIKQNFLSGFGQPTLVLPWVNLQVLFAAGNLLIGSLPIPPEYIVYYSVSDNKLTGEISPSICKLRTLQYLDLSNNKLSGTIPQCLGNFSDDLRVLDLRNNSLQGILPQPYSNASNLRLIDVSYNQFHGQLPRSLANCAMLESLVLSNNEFNDDFPTWLGMLPDLKLLAMNHNEFNGVIKNSTKNLHFPELLILDLSHNSFKGEFPLVIFSGNAMRGIAQSQPTYMDTSSALNIPGAPLFSYGFSMTITNKGVERYYEKIREDLGFVDISSNKFAGKIPEFIGNLKGLRFLNISHNIFSGSIPSSLGNLILLESLDLSQNKLAGEIPQKLAQLTSLAYFNVSHNNLTGAIPLGRQFQTFESTSYEGNSGLCGDPLPKKCGNSNAPSQLPPSSIEENDSGSGVELDWIFILAGFGSGLVVGVVLANEGIKWRRELFLEIVGMLIRLMKRIRRQRRN